MPELVRENKDGMLSMRHQGIAPILLEAIKELKAEIEELKINVIVISNGSTNFRSIIDGVYSARSVIWHLGFRNYNWTNIYV